MRITDADIARKYLNKGNNCTNDGTDFELSFAQYKRVVTTKRCHYTGVLLTWKGSGQNIQATDLTVDRVDNNLGYVQGNVVACSHAANKLKSIWENPTTNLNFKQVKHMVSVLDRRMK